MAIAAFLPLLEPTGIFRMVQNNTLIQHGGWTLVALAVGIAASSVWANQRGGRWWGLAVGLCLLAAAQITDWATDKDLRTLYPVGLNGTVDTSQPGMVASLGIALYAAGTGVAVALIGSVMLRQAQPDRVVPEVDGSGQTKKCPDCAETVPADAHVCHYCAHRFASDTPHEKSTKVKCHHCQHVQLVPVTQQTFACEKCGTKLKRLTTPVKDS
ncbi:zinc ribbon domain-containing protein [Mycobacterium sp. E735]|uniref:zinc ribbon domain-containing protein n=1 Tax=Mycobacterium sp. E735 TaxID=1834148 RepID=UPI0008005F8B|nr:zinc ribbon domain-containing protein [Mycobacterium sp. E735]OBG51835.1 hypothetical protein A5704_00905 [Mycobacterium sp. E735]